MIRRRAADSRRPRKSSILNTKLVGGPGFEPGASRSRTVSVPCPPVSDRLLRVLLYLIGAMVVTVRVLSCPPGSGIAWHRCDLRGGQCHRCGASASWRDPVSRLSTPLSSDRAVLIAMSCHTRLGYKARRKNIFLASSRQRATRKEDAMDGSDSTRSPPLTNPSTPPVRWDVPSPSLARALHQVISRNRVSAAEPTKRRSLLGTNRRCIR